MDSQSELVLTPDVVKKIAAWALSGDTGVSSTTIASIALGLSEEQTAHYFDIPGDSGDFGRCYRLLKAIPELHAALPLVAVTFPKYRPLIEHWDELTALYEKDESEEPVYQMVSRGRGRPRMKVLTNKKSCYTKIRELRDACMLADGWQKVCSGCWEYEFRREQP